MAAIKAVKGSDGTDHVETVGGDRSRVREWNTTLDGALSDLEFWGCIWERRNRGTARITAHRDGEGDTEDSDSPAGAVEQGEGAHADGTDAAPRPPTDS